MKVVGIVPARGGSLGIIRKNLAHCNGKPLIYWTIQAAKRSSLDALYVSTDDDEIANYAHGEGVEILWRPAHLAIDTAKTVDALRWHLTHELVGQYFDAVFTLQPTNPLRTREMIDGALELLGEADSVCSFTDVGERHPARMYVRRGIRGEIESVDKEQEWLPRQQLPPWYLRTGEIYLTRTGAILNGSMRGESTVPYVIDYGECWNVDDQTDLVIVEALMKARDADA